MHRTPFPSLAAALLALLATTGCNHYVAAPALRPGMTVRVASPVRIAVRGASTDSLAPPCHAARVEGRVESVHGDTIVLANAKISATMDAGCTLIQRAVLSTRADGAMVTVPKTDAVTTATIGVIGVYLIGITLALSDRPW